MKRASVFYSMLLFCCCTLPATQGVAQQIATPESQVKDPNFEMTNYSLYVNRQPIYENAGSFGGTVIWFFLPDQGQFIFSTTPRKGYDFQKVGIITGNTISFWHNNNLYEWISRSPIISDQSATELWLMIDSKYIAKDCARRVCFGSAAPFDHFMKDRQAMSDTPDTYR